jgi:hypothetical protein
VANAVDYEARRLTLSKPALLSFPNLHEAKRVSKSTKEEPKFSARFELEADSPDLKALRAKIISQAIEFANSNDGKAFRAVAGNTVESIAAAIKAGAIKTCIEDGEKLADKAKAKSSDGKRLREWSRGLKVVTTRSQKWPPCGIVANGAIVQLDGPEQVKLHQAKFFYTGVKALAELDIVAYNPVGEDGKPGVTAYLASVLSTGKGEKLISGGANLAATFSGYVGLESDEDPTGGQAAAEDADW